MRRSLNLYKNVQGVYIFIIKKKKKGGGGVELRRGKWRTVWRKNGVESSGSPCFREEE